MLDLDLLPDEVTAPRHKVADAAEAGDWPALFDLLDETATLSPNQWRPGSPMWSTPLHQAARLGASAKVITALTERGALLSLRDAQGRTAHDVALEQRQPTASIDLLTPPPPPLSAELNRALDANLEWVIDGTIRTTQILKDRSDRDLRRALRYPPVAILHEAPGQSVSLAIPGLPNSIQITLRNAYLETVCAGQVHVVTHHSALLASEIARISPEPTGR
ncbi:ankyrin repeat domain-containing protein [Mycolicibacter minnesotensis]